MKIKLKNIKIGSFGLFVIGFVIGLTVMYLYLQPKLTYQGKSVVDWAVTANKNANDNIQLKQVAQDLQAKLEQFQNAPTPTPVIQYQTPSVDLPPGCDVTINAYMKLGYSRSMTNQLLKSARPECSY